LLQGGEGKRDNSIVTITVKAVNFSHPTVTLPAGGRAAAGSGTWGEATLHGGPVRLRPVWATPWLMLDVRRLNKQH